MTTRAFLLLIGTSGCAVYTDITRTDEAPTASILAPSDGSVVPAGRLELLGRVSDAVDPAERVFATWSIEEPGGWRDVCRGLAEADGTTTCLAEVGPEVTAVRLVAQDVPGYRGTDRVALVVRPTYAPVVTLLAPDAATRLYANVPIRVAARIADEDDVPSELAVRWESDVLGTVEGPAAVDAQGGLDGVVRLPAGEHRLRLVVTDPDGAVGDASVRVAVRAGNLPPRVRVDAPERGAALAEGALVVVDAVVTDDVTPLEDLVVTVASDLDGPFAAVERDDLGRVTARRSDLRVGVHVITVSATDDAPAEGAEQRTLVVDRPPVLTVLEPADGAVLPEGAYVAVRAVATDENPGVDDLTFEVFSSFAGSILRTPSDPGTLDARVALPPGRHTLTVRAIDGFGLVSEVVRGIDVGVLATR